MAPPILTYDQVMEVRKALYDSAIASGKITPPLWPWDTLVMVYLFMPIYCRPYLSQMSSKILDVIVFAAIVLHSCFMFTHRRSLGAASGYGWGLAMSWGWVMSATFLLLHDVGTDFLRVEWREVPSGKDKDVSSAKASSLNLSGDDSSNTVKKRQINEDSSVPKETSSREKPSQQSSKEYCLVWQALPSTAYHRMDWAIDLMTSFRGPNWNYRIPTMSKVAIQAPDTTHNQRVNFSSAWKMDSKTSSTKAQGERTSIAEDGYDTASNRSLRYKTVIKWLFSYVLIDVIKCVMISDPYFLGLSSLDSPTSWHIIPTISDATGLPVAFLIRFLRLIISMTGVISALFLIFSLSPLFFYIILPKLITNPRNISYAPLLDSRSYPGFLQFPFPLIADKGLAGFWGRCWHQMFRFGISEPSRILIEKLGLHPRSQLSRVIQLFIAFGLTGFLHFAGSYTCFSIIESKPWDPFWFFILQAVGITLQTFLSDVVLGSQLRLKDKMPKTIKRITNVSFVVLWLYYTGPLLADDFSRCGIWLFEPVPVSIIRGLRGERWWVWHGRLVGWYDGSVAVSNFARPLTGGSGVTRNGIWNKGLAVF